MSRYLTVLIALVCLSLVAVTQDSLPGFSAVNIGSDRIIISWTNTYGKAIRQLSIQRSFDSLKNFKTILTLPDPTVPQNGYVDSKATTNHMFYRLFILKDSGKYVFSVPKRPKTDTAFNLNNTITEKLADETPGITKMNGLNDLKRKAQLTNEKIIFVKIKDVLLGAISESSLKRFKDSVNYSTKDTLFMKTFDTMVIRPFTTKEIYRPSRFVFTDIDGNVKISLDEVVSRKYALKFFEEDNTEIFEIKRITDKLVILDKTNFIHSGWFLFELYEDGKLKEKHKFYVPKDF